MAGGKFSEALLNGMTIRESANDGSDFTNPSADYRRLFLGEDGELHVKDSAGTVTSIGGGGGVATDTIWDAAGDLAVGSGSNTAARLAIGATNGMVLTRVSGAVAWALPPAYEYDYVQITSPVNVTATAEASANTIITGSSVTYDGSTIVLIECFFPYITLVNQSDFQLWLYDGSSSIGTMALRSAVTATGISGNQRQGGVMARRLTPSAAAHTYSIRGTTSTGTAVAGAGAGGSGNHAPAYIRITKV